MKNSHGDIIGLTDITGTLTETYGYDAFGTLTKIRSLNAEGVLAEAETALSRFLYAGEQYDAVTGLYYLRARQYDTVVGRFTQEDTYLGDGRNLYVYVQNNPLKYVDPSGYCRREGIERMRPVMRQDRETPMIEDGMSDSAERAMSGALNVLKGAASVTAGVIVAVCMPVATPALVQLAVGTVALTSAGMGVYDISEGVQDVYYGLSGDVNSQSVHPIKDYCFHGNQKAYNKAEKTLQIGTALGGLGTLVFSPKITAENVANYANMMEQGLDFFDAVEEVSESGSSSEGIAVTEEAIRAAMEDAPLKTQQESVSIPVIQNYVDRILAGETDIPPIKVDGNIIIDGNHRYIASRIAGIEVEVQEWSGGNADKVIDWIEMILDYFDWGNR